MKYLKYLFIVVIALTVIVGGYLIFLNNFQIFETTETQLAKFKNKKTGMFYQLNTSSGNATAPNSLRLYKVDGEFEKQVFGLETYPFYVRNQEIYYLNDSTLRLKLYSEKGLDTLMVLLYNGNEKMFIERK